MEKKVRVLIVDDSALVRQALTDVFSQDPEIEILGTASDPFVAARRIKDIVPDVITLDVEMPRMDGLTFLKKIMSQHPIPVVICSSLAGTKTETALRALELGAVDIIEKPKLGTKQFFRESAIRICDTVKAASMAKTGKSKPLNRPVQPKLGADAVLSGPVSQAMVETTEKIVVVGASTGGTEALRVFLEVLPQDAPAIAIVQHMPEKFTQAFANRLNGICRVNVKEAENNDALLRGSVLIAPGNRHLLVKRSGARYYVETRDGPLVSRHRPSVDVLFRSAARYGGKNVIGVIMTGMGDDGAQGMLEMKNAGARNFAQNEASCVVFGMPKEAVKKGAVDAQLPLESLAEAVLKAAAQP